MPNTEFIAKVQLILDMYSTLVDGLQLVQQDGLPTERQVALRLCLQVERTEQAALRLWTDEDYLSAMALARIIFEYYVTSSWILKNPTKVGRFLEDPDYEVGIANMADSVSDPDQHVFRQYYGAASKWTHPRHHIMKTAGRNDSETVNFLRTETESGLRGAFGLALLPVQQLVDTRFGFGPFLAWSQRITEIHLRNQELG